MDEIDKTYRSMFIFKFNHVFVAKVMKRDEPALHYDGAVLKIGT